jgi:hypothetical protein
MHLSSQAKLYSGLRVEGANAWRTSRVDQYTDQVEQLAQGADIIVHSAIHPIMAPGRGSGMYPYAYLRQKSLILPPWQSVRV